MSITKHTFFNFCVLISCLTICYLLFSLDVTKFQQHKSSPKMKTPLNLYPKPFKLFDLDFKYLINNRVCDHSDNILAVIIVTSYHSNVETRSAMRRAFNAEELKTMKLRRVFLLAIGSNKKYDISHEALLNENERFGDLIQGNFQEAYKNLTYKHLMGLHWATSYCSGAKFLIKMDDDIVFDMFKTINLLQNLNLNKNPIAGYVFKNHAPIREPANKWFITRNEYRNSLYPNFVSGWFYITTPKFARILIKQSYNSEYFWVDDVYVTGILTKSLQIEHMNLNKLFAVHPGYLECCIRDVQVYKYECEFLIGPNGGDNNLYLTFNRVMSHCVKGLCISRPRGKKVNNTCVVEHKIHIGRGKPLIETVHFF